VGGGSQLAKPDIDVVIVDFNTGQLIQDCLGSLAQHVPRLSRLARVVVVDNASSKPTADFLNVNNLPLQIIRNSENRGFAAACNQGAACGEAPYILFLNPDTVLQPDSMSVPIEFMERPENARVGICGIQLVDKRGQVGRTCARFPTTSIFVAKMLGLDRLWPQRFPPHFMVEWDHTVTRRVDQVMGAFFLVRRSLFEALGGFDERFFVYFEEVDFSWRARQAGWLTYYVAEAQVYHRGGGTSEQVKASRLFYSLRSRILYGYKHFGWLSATVLALATLVIEPITRVGLALAHASGQSVPETLRAYGRLWRDMLRVFPSSNNRFV
jgi:N-acetylglucosaminyl-diphospho-decaprenol L-rhamnosyltransferase